MVGGSFRNFKRSGSSMGSGNNSADSSHISDDSDIQMQGWMRKQKETLRSWARRYFTLSGQVLTYYDSEDTSRGARGVLDFVDVAPLTTENNGLALHLANGKEVRLIADTHVAYSAWMTVFRAALNAPQSSSKSGAKDGWAHCLTDNEEWTRYFVVVKNDSFSCYESEDEDAELALSGLVRSVDDWEGKRFGLVVSLNRARKIKLAFDSAEEKMSWFLTLEFSVSYGTARMKKEASMRYEKMSSLGKSDSSMATATAAQPSGDAAEDDGVWI